MDAQAALEAAKDVEKAEGVRTRAVSIKNYKRAERNLLRKRKQHSIATSTRFWTVRDRLFRCIRLLVVAVLLVMP